MQDKFNGFIVLNDQPISSYKISKNVKVKQDLMSLEKLMNYTVYITINENLNLHKQAQNIFECISVIKKQKFMPDSITICLGDFDFLTVNDWQTISSYSDTLFKLVNAVNNSSDDSKLSKKSLS